MKDGEEKKNEEQQEKKTKKRRKEKRQNLGLPWAPKTPKPTYRNTLIPVSSRDMILISFPSLWQILEQTV